MTKIRQVITWMCGGAAGASAGLAIWTPEVMRWLLTGMLFLTIGGAVAPGGQKSGARR